MGQEDEGVVPLRAGVLLEPTSANSKRTYGEVTRPVWNAQLVCECSEASTTGYGLFVECPRLYRVFFIGHSVKRLFAECQRESTRQTTSTRQKGGLPSAEHSAKNKTRQRPGLPSVKQ